MVLLGKHKNNPIWKTNVTHFPVIQKRKKSEADTWESFFSRIDLDL